MRRRYNKTKGLLISLAAVIILIAVAGIVWSKALVVRNVVIDSADEISRDEMIRASQIELGGHISKVDAERLKENLEDSGRYSLENVEIRYPDTVVLSVRERTRDAVVINGGQYLVMDADGYVIEILSAMPENSGVYVYGLDVMDVRVGKRVTASEEKLSAMKETLVSIRAQGVAPYISELDVSDVEQLCMTMRTGMRVELGNSDNMDSKLIWMRSAVNDLEQRGEVFGTLDVSSGDKADYTP